MSIPRDAGWEAHDLKVRPYVRRHRFVGLLSRVTGLLLLFAALREYRALHLEWWLEGRGFSGYWLWLVYFAIVAIVFGLPSFGFSYLTYRIERAFGLSRQKIGSWLADQLKGLAVGAVLGSLALGLLYVSIVFAGKSWWWVAATLLVLFTVVLAQLAPVLLIPIFFKLRPMEPGPLKERLLQLCSRHSVLVKDVYHLGLGEKTEKGNAAFVGIGSTKRIIIGDTLYEKFPHEEVEAVFAHELGHQVHNDLWKGLCLSAFHQYLGFFVASRVLPYIHGPVLDGPYALFLFMIVVSIVHFPLGFLESVFSRSRERAADRFAAEKTGLGAPLAGALERLTLQNWGYFRPNRVREFFTYSHPAPWRRITALRSVRNSSA